MLRVKIKNHAQKDLSRAFSALYFDGVYDLLHFDDLETRARSSDVLER